MHKCSLDPFGGRGFLSVAWLGEISFQLIFSNSILPCPHRVTTYCCCMLGFISHPPWMESRKDSQTAYTQGHSVVSIWLKEISCLHGSMKGGSADSPHFYLGLFLSTGVWVVIGEECMQRVQQAHQGCYPGKPLMRDWDFSLYFMGNPESLKEILLVDPSLDLGKRNILLSPFSLQVIKMMILSSTLPLSSTYMVLGSGRGKGAMLGYWWWVG